MRDEFGGVFLLLIRWLYAIAIGVAFQGCSDESFRAAKRSQGEYERCLEAHREDPKYCGYLREPASKDYDQYEASGFPKRWERTWSP